jgi:serine/threonine protein kinase
VGTERAWEKEAMALDAINSINHDNIIKCLAAIRRGDHRYFMFPWANGGSLRDFWEATPEQTPKADIIRQVITQFRGLADALYQLHNYAGKSIVQEGELAQPTSRVPDLRVQGEVVVVTGDSYSQSIRHGDLKPENILRFLSDPTITTDLGVLKLADMGLAKRHVSLTQDRTCLTSTRYGTIQYEAPETVTALEGEGRSRLYDIWSMGCILLESIIWILYGNVELNNFYEQVKGETQETRYFEIRADGTGADVHHVVRRWMDHIQNTDPECTQESAIRDLLNLVRTKLLVVDLPPRRPSNMMGNIGPHLEMPRPGEDKKTYRTSGESFVESLDAIISKIADEKYVQTGKGRENVKAPAYVGSGFLAVSSARRSQGTSTLRNEVPGGLSANVNSGKITRADYALPPLEEWEFPVDNAFADEALATLGPESMKLLLSVPATLCNRCENLNFWAGGFSIEDNVLDLQERSDKCEFCRMLLAVCTEAGTAKTPTVVFERNESTLRLSGSQSLPVLSIFRSPGK